MTKIISSILSTACPERSRRVKCQLLIVLTLLLVTSYLLPATTPIFAQPLGTIKPPVEFNIPTTGGDPNRFVAGVIRTGITLLILVGFVVALIWTILAGFRFILANGDPKDVASAWSQIYWGLIGMAVMLGSYAIIIMVEKVFRVSIISGPLVLPRIPTL